MPRDKQRLHLAHCGLSPPFHSFISNPQLLINTSTVQADFLSQLILCLRPCASLIVCFSVVPQLMHLFSINPLIASCLLAPPRSRSTHPKNSSRHPVTSLSQPCQKTCMSSNDNCTLGCNIRFSFYY